MKKEKKKKRAVYRLKIGKRCSQSCGKWTSGGLFVVVLPKLIRSFSSEGQYQTSTYAVVFVFVDGHLSNKSFLPFLELVLEKVDFMFDKENFLHEAR